MQNMLPQAIVTPMFAQGSAPSGAPGGNMFLIVMVLMFVGMYFLTIAPHRAAPSPGHDGCLLECPWAGEGDAAGTSSAGGTCFAG